MKLVHATWEPAGNGPFPTIFAMHGWGSNAMDLQGLAPYIADGRFMVICPQGSVEVEIGAINGYGWYQMRMGSQPDPDKVDVGGRECASFSTRPPLAIRLIRAKSSWPASARAA